MTLTELRYVVSLAQLRHFGRAAQNCNVSQPTLSVAINKLEKELGIAIFERDRNTVRVTEIGQAIVAQAQRTLEQADNIRAIAKSNKSELNQPLKVGAIYTIGPYLFPNLIPKLQKLTPEMPLIIHEDYTANLKTKLQLGDLDAIFISLPFADTNIVTQNLYDESFVVLLRQDHPLSKKKFIQTSDLPASEMLLLGEGHCFREQVLQACPHCYGDNDKSVIGTSIETLRHMIASGMGISILPSSAASIDYYQSILCIRPFFGEVPQRRVALAWRLSFTRPKAIGALIKALQQIKMHGICLLP